MVKDGIYLNKKDVERLKGILSSIANLELHADETKALKEIIEGIEKEQAGLNAAIKEHYENKSGSETEKKGYV